MLRRLFTLASVLSLLLCGATMVMWARSYWFEDVLGYSFGRPVSCDPDVDYPSTGQWYLVAASGQFVIIRSAWKYPSLNFGWNRSWIRPGSFHPRW
jgi:hypothetical protein